MTFRLRPLRHEDLAVLVVLHAQCFPDEAWDSAALATILALPGTGGRLAIAASGEMLGFLVDQCLGPDAEILTLGVAPGARRRGIAQMLLRDLFARAAAMSAQRVVLEVAADNRGALALYEALGFSRRGRRRGYYRRASGPPVDAWRLDRDISLLPAP